MTESKSRQKRNPPLDLRCHRKSHIALGRDDATHLRAHLALKEAALAKLTPYERGKPTRFQPNDRLLAFREAL